MYAIVDIETTGGFGYENKITEVAVIVHDGQREIRRYETLINPGRSIPPYVSMLTGITDEMVETAPVFEQVAPQLFEILSSNIFVAHNVGFDYTFIESELKTAGYNFESKKLCTVKLSRSLIPGYKSYSLGKLCTQLGIEVQNRHRAGGDCEATVKLFEILLSSDHDGLIAKSLKKNSENYVLPPNLPPDQFQNLPDTPGVYYFHDQKGETIYVGKAKNIKKRVKSHFTGKAPNGRKLKFLNKIHGISFEPCGNELIALLLESSEIRKHWPEFNVSQKKPDMVFGVFHYEDQSGYGRLGVNKVNKTDSPLIKFRYQTEARNFLERKIMEFNLCPKLSGIQTTNSQCYNFPEGNCSGACIGAETGAEYNKRLQLALDSIEKELPSYIISGTGRDKDERSVILVEKGIYRGFGFVDKEQGFTEPASIRDFIKPYPDHPEIRKILNAHLENPGREKVIFF